MSEILNLAELKNSAMGFDRAEMRDVHIIKDNIDYLSRRHMGVWNLDKNELACLAPKNYMVIHHKYATECIIDAITSLNIKAEAKLKTSRHGIHIDFDFPDSRIELSEVGESFTSGIRLVNEYDKVQGLVISAKVTRLACSNGMIVNDIVKPHRIKYTEELKQTVEGLIDKIIRDIVSNDSKLANMVSICMKDSAEWQTVRLLLKALFRKKKHVKEILARTTNNESGRITRWDFYNAITNYASDSGRRLKPQVDEFLQNKAQKILATPFNKLTEELVTVGEKTVT